MLTIPLVTTLPLLASIASANTSAVQTPSTTFKPSATASGAASDCCGPLAEALKGKVFSPQSSEYDTLINDRWSGTSVLHPGCVVAPTCADDVSKAVKVLTKNLCKFAVRSGGHNANPGANSIDGGVSIDLSKLNKATLAKDRSHVSLDAGVTWGQAYDTFTNDRIGFTGGICEDVGVSGVGLGGGQSLFQPKRGWAVDNVINYELVLATGDVVNANQTGNPDLFKALKGGNTNFGIVTRVDIAAFDFDGLWAGESFFSLEAKPGSKLPASRDDVLDQISNALTDFTARNHEDTDSGVQLMTVYLRKQQGHILNAAFANTANKSEPELLKPFLEIPNIIPNMSHTEHTKMADFVHKVSAFQAKGHRQVTASITYFNDAATTREIWDATDDIYNSLSFKDDLDWMISFIPQPKIQQSHSAERGGNSLGLENVEKDQMVLWLTTRWDSPELDSEMEEVRKRFIDAVEEVAKRHDTYHPFIYINYAAPTQNPLCGYGKESVAYLKKTSQKYDPNRAFQKLMPGGFKLDDVDCV